MLLKSRTQLHISSFHGLSKQPTIVARSMARNVIPCYRRELSRHVSNAPRMRTANILKPRSTLFGSKPISRHYSDALHLQGIEPRKGDPVVIAMSGGVDSSVAAKILAMKDYDLRAVFMRNWDERDESASDSGCTWEKSWEKVQSVCRMLDIPCQMIDLSREYWTRVFQPALDLWEIGQTPNPDIWCNKEVKFGALLNRVDALYSASGIKPWLATGHYARKGWASSNDIASPRPQLLRAVDDTKDQSYYLSSIPELSLSRALFPLGELKKSEVRTLAREWDLPTADEPESMGLCFVGERRRFHSFIGQYLPPSPGNFVDISDPNNRKVIGQHNGLWTATVGQNARISGQKQKYFVVSKNEATNEILVAEDDNPALYSQGLTVQNWQWIWANEPHHNLSKNDTPGLRMGWSYTHPTTQESSENHPPLLSSFRARVKHRYRMESVPCTVNSIPGAKSGMQILFDTPQKAVTVGQVATLYHEDWCLGCGLITKTESQQ